MSSSRVTLRSQSGFSSGKKLLCAPLDTIFPQFFCLNRRTACYKVGLLMTRPGDGALIGDFHRQLREGPLSEFYTAPSWKPWKRMTMVPIQGFPPLQGIGGGAPARGDECKYGRRDANQAVLGGGRGAKAEGPALLHRKYTVCYESTLCK